MKVLLCASLLPNTFIENPFPDRYMVASVKTVIVAPFIKVIRVYKNHMNCVFKYKSHPFPYQIARDNWVTIDDALWTCQKPT